MLVDIWVKRHVVYVGAFGQTVLGDAVPKHLLLEIHDAVVETHG
jgi:hypothetical protein